MKEKVLNWTQQFDTFCFLDNHGYQIQPHSEECLLAAGKKRSININSGNALPQLQQFIDEKPVWLFGHMAYDLKNEIENLTSLHADRIGFPGIFFFEPEIIIQLSEKEMIIGAEEPEGVFSEIEKMNFYEKESNHKEIIIQQQLNRDEYISTIKKLQQHILRGDCYEINFCQEFFAENVMIDPVLVYKNLSEISPNPFSALYRVNDKWLVCASPERFLKKTGNTILSQPIKGTSKRDLQNDEQAKKELYHSAKDRSENVMVVDLVRNDLAKVCKEGTVKVDELYGIYSFPQVHQMISTVSGQLKENISFTDIIKATFPMGSMTGAPKRSVMQLIEQYEKTKRGIFSGAMGYITPFPSPLVERGARGEVDFDFNVVIRSIMYNSTTKSLSFQAGSGITFYSDAEKEWEECLLKAEAIKKVLTHVC